VIKFSFSYLIYRWVSRQGIRNLVLQNGEDSNYGPLSPGFPVVGQRVKVFWSNYNEWFAATVQRWSSHKKQWVLKYDEWDDCVYEDVTVLDWQFL
jgi:hypothetical protein